ncbi:hypothetical protein DOTSEDRAFT_71487 [Dothistroma septosporum NZE10]|uniref:DUF7907 domain-containing protein n=1 Tax=Dothistroma septosporum (strain NZE10 / CBS 128990) TaxID=675120 RepID=N1PTS2_DOTSN|nr:hypothetical protein DOTSEDRAFT_71487 [Dothistroma septosporum NZE10]
MKTVAAASAALLSLASVATAQTVQSKPFYLVLDCASKYNGSALVSCHEGAGIESLCVAATLGSNVKGSTYMLNTTTGEVGDKNAGTPGTLVYKLPISGGVGESEPMQLSYNEASNVALPLFEPSTTATLVAFDKDNHMNIQSYIDDTVVPAKTGELAYYRWYVCKSNYEGTQYSTLNWVAGKYPPQNPSCEKVEVVRKFA